MNNLKQRTYILALEELNKAYDLAYELNDNKSLNEIIKKMGELIDSNDTNNVKITTVH